MTRFIAFTPLSTPGLHVWREGTNSDAYLHPVPDNTLPPGAFAFETQLGAGPQEHVLCQLFAWAGSGKSDWEKPEHIHRVPRLPDNTLPAVVYIFHGSERVLLADPFSRTEQTLRVHLITASKYI